MTIRKPNYNISFNDICKHLFRNTLVFKSKGNLFITLTIQYTIYILIEYFFNSLTKSFIIIVKYKGDRYVFSTSTKRRSSCES